MTKSNPAAPERAWLDVDLGALLRNARRFEQLTAARLLPMVKANGYGLGSVAVTRALEAIEPWGYGVATTAEGAELRAAGIARPIVVFTPLTPDGSSIPGIRASSLCPVIGDLEALDRWLSSGAGPFHLEIDTGMSRSGIRWSDAAALQSLRERLRAAPDWEGLFTHFHSADSDPASAFEQLERFRSVLDAIGRRPPLVHWSNSAAAALDLPLRAELARPGIFLYGGQAGSLQPEAVARLQARVVAVRRLAPGDTVSYGAEGRVSVATTVATVAIGYGDGVPRALSRGGGGLVELGGTLRPIVGRVTMDMLMLDVGGEPAQVAPGEAATIFGGLVSLDAQAAKAQMVSYELLTRIAPRVVRRYWSS